jgi:TonB family protein
VARNGTVGENATVQLTKQWHRENRLIVVLLIAGWAASGCAQEPIEVSRPMAVAHLKPLTRPLGDYPDPARREHVQGAVEVRALVGKDGRILRVEATSGPLGLRFQAERMVRLREYEPFTRNGTAVEAWVTTTVHFNVEGPDTVAQGQQFEKAFEDCRKHANDGTAGVAACEHARQLGDELRPGSRWAGDHEQSLLLLATALLASNRPAEAVAASRRAVADVNTNGAAPHVTMAAYGIAGEAEASVGDLVGADRDLRDAEEFGRLAIRAPKAPSHDWAVSRQRSLLKMHARVLQALKQDTDAQAKLAEAAAL